jgi:predicted AAA+ superfamily ATPase
MSAPELFESNPWWTDPRAIDEDIIVKEWDNSKFKWRPRLGETIQWDVDVIYVLRGPRQVGKTTLCKLKIRELLRSGIAPRAIFYWACDLVEGPDKLVKIIDGYLTFSKGAAERRFIFLDEISSVRDWQKGIKYLYDRGRLRGCTVVLTGSHSIDLRRATESLAGRRGDVHKLKDRLPDKILLPMKFSEYAESRSEEIAQLIKDQGFLVRNKRHQLLSAIAQGQLPKELEEAYLFSKELNRLYHEYLITGGIPRAINAFVSDGTISRDIYERYIELLLRDIRKWDGNESLMRQIVKRLVETQGSPVSLRNLQEDTEISSHHTVSKYLDFLKDSFVVSVIYKLDQNKDVPSYKEGKKIHFEDPFIFHALRSWLLGSEPYEEALRYLGKQENLGKLTECVVANHLVRLLFGLFPSAQFDYSSLLFYWQSKKKRELDFAIKHPSGRYLPLEVKYQERISREDAFGIFDFQKSGKSLNGVLLTKNKLELKNSYIEIPVPVFLLLV